MQSKEESDYTIHNSESPYQVARAFYWTLRRIERFLEEGVPTKPIVAYDSLAGVPAPLPPALFTDIPLPKKPSKKGKFTNEGPVSK